MIGFTDSAGLERLGALLGATQPLEFNPASGEKPSPRPGLQAYQHLQIRSLEPAQGTGLPETHCQSLPELGQMPRCSQSQAQVSCHPGRPCHVPSGGLGQLHPRATLVTEIRRQDVAIWHPSAGRAAPWCPSSPGCSGRDPSCLRASPASSTSTPLHAFRDHQPTGHLPLWLRSGVYVHASLHCFRRVGSVSCSYLCLGSPSRLKWRVWCIGKNPEERTGSNPGPDLPTVQYP